MSNSRKKVIVRQFSGNVLPGYLPNSRIVHAGALELLDLSGRIVPVMLGEIKMVSYVRDFNLTDISNPERLVRKTFLARPRSEGLWVRITFRSGDLLEGLAAIDHSLLDGLVEDGGLYLIPADVRSNTQRIYVPRSAIAEMQLLAVITSPSRRQPVASQQENSLQDELFQLPLAPDSRPN